MEILLGMYYKVMTKCTHYCIHGYFRGGFIFANFASQSSQKISTSIYMAIDSNENITKIAKFSHRVFPHLVQNCEIICTRNIWRIQ